MESSTNNPLHNKETDPFVMGGDAAVPAASTTTSSSSDWMTSKLTVEDSTIAIQNVPTYEIDPVDIGAMPNLPLSTGGGGGHGHDDHHGTIIAPTRVPEWMGNIIEKVFKVKKRGTTVEVRSMLHCVNATLLGSRIFPHD